MRSHRSRVLPGQARQYLVIAAVRLLHASAPTTPHPRLARYPRQCTPPLPPLPPTSFPAQTRPTSPELLKQQYPDRSRVPTSVSVAPRRFFLQLADVARTPWLDPCVAGLILTVKALSEGDWRLGKGALAAWADQALRAVSDSGAKVLRLSSGDEVRRRWLGWSRVCGDKQICY